jgi:hypothetical protein
MLRHQTVKAYTTNMIIGFMHKGQINESTLLCLNVQVPIIYSYERL